MKIAKTETPAPMGLDRHRAKPEPEMVWIPNIVAIPIELMPSYVSGCAVWLTEHEMQKFLTMVKQPEAERMRVPLKRVIVCARRLNAPVSLLDAQGNVLNRWNP